MNYVDMLPHVRQLLTRRSMPCFDERVLLTRVATKVERACEKLGSVDAAGVRAVVRFGGVVCFDGKQHYVETGLVGIDLPKFGSDDLYDRLTGNLVN